MEAGDENEGDVHHVGAWSIPRIRDAHLVLVGPNFSGCHSFRYGPLRGIKHFELADSCRCSDCCGPVRTEPGRTVRFWCVNPCQNYMDKCSKIGLSILWQMWQKPKLYPNLTCDIFYNQYQVIKVLWVISKWCYAVLYSALQCVLY